MQTIKVNIIGFVLLVLLSELFGFSLVGLGDAAVVVITSASTDAHLLNSCCNLNVLAAAFRYWIWSGFVGV